MPETPSDARPSETADQMGDDPAGRAEFARTEDPNDAPVTRPDESRPASERPTGGDTPIGGAD